MLTVADIERWSAVSVREDEDTGTPPVSLTTIGDLKPPPGTEPNALVALTGEI